MGIPVHKVRMGDLADSGDRDAAPAREAPARPVLDKRRLLLMVGGLVLGGVSLALVVLWQRDTTYIKKSVERMQPYRAAVQAAVDTSGQFPLAMPKFAPNGRALPEKGFIYLPVDDLRDLREYDGAVLLGFSLPVSSAIRSDGRAALLCERGQCVVRWMTHAEIGAHRKAQEAWIKQRREKLLQAPPQLP